MCVCVVATSSWPGIWQVACVIRCHDVIWQQLGQHTERERERMRAYPGPVSILGQLHLQSCRRRLAMANSTTLNLPLPPPLFPPLHLPLLNAGGRKPCGIEYTVPGLRRNRLAKAQIINGRLGIRYARIDVHLASLHCHRTTAHRARAGLHHKAIDDAADAGETRQRQDEHKQRGGQRADGAEPAMS